MKTVLVLAALYGLASCDSKCTSSSTPNLADDFNDITDKIPVADVKNVVSKYSADDGYKAVVEYLSGSSFQSTFQQVMKEKIIAELIQYLCSGGYSFSEQLERVNGLLWSLKFNTASRASPTATTNLKTFVQDVIKTLPEAEMKAVFEEKKNSSAAFKHVYDIIFSKDFNASIVKIMALPGTQEGNAILAKYGVTVKEFFTMMQDLFGWMETVTATSD